MRSDGVCTIIGDRVFVMALTQAIYSAPGLGGILLEQTMIPLSLPDKRAALMGVFINRFSLGCMIGAVAVPWPGWLSGLVVGVLLSLADAIITKA